MQIPQARRPRPIVEHVTDVGVAQLARDGGALHAEAHVDLFIDIVLVDRLPEARPAGVRFEFRLGVEECRVAADAAIDSFVVQVPVSPVNGRSVPRDG